MRSISDYLEAVAEAFESIDPAAVARAIEEINLARINRCQIFVAGNGGSAAIADHLVCDWLKGTHDPPRPPIDVHSLVSNVPLLTACANDFQYAECFSAQLEMRAQPGDVLVVISSSGMSPNIVYALHAAREIPIVSIAFTGFDGGEAARLAAINIHVASTNYGVVEDCHQMLMHYIAQHIYGKDHGKSPSQER